MRGRDKEVAEKIEKILMNCIVGGVEDSRGTIKLLSYERLKNGKVVERWKTIVCEIRSELRTTDKGKCLDYAINLLYSFDTSKADELMRKFREADENELMLDNLLADVREALKQFNIKLFVF